MPSAAVEAQRRATARACGLPAAAASLVPLLGSALVIVSNSRFAADGFDSTEFSATVRDDPAAVEAARHALAPWLAPVGVDNAVAMLGELGLLTKRRAGDDDSDDLTLRAYARRLAEYPRDAAEYVLTGWASSQVFWPAWAELQSALDRRVRVRRQFAKALGP